MILIQIYFYYQLNHIQYYFLKSLRLNFFNFFINSYYLYLLFKPEIYFSSYNKITLRNEIPKENTSDFSGLKDPIPD